MRVEGEKLEGPRSSKGVRTRARLIQAAQEIFQEHGFHDARISDIAERAGLSYGSFYHYFPSKEEIFREVADAQEPQLDVGLPEDRSGSIESTGDRGLPEDLAAAIRRYLSAYSQAAQIMGVIEQVSRFDALVASARLDRHTRGCEHLARTIEHLQDEGSADSAIDPTLGAHALMAMVTRFAEAWFVQGQLDCTFDDGVAQLTILCFNALQGSRKVEGESSEN
jgi:AcrR family transcriptional regulator